MYHQAQHSCSGIQGHLLEATVVGCSKLKDTEWLSRQDPYVCLEYGGTKYRTRTCTDGGKHPIFQEKFTFSMIEGVRELNVVVWNSNTITLDDLIGSGKIQLQKVFSEGYDDSSWPVQTKTGRHAGEVRVILHYPNAKNPPASYASSAPPYITPSAPQVPLYTTPPPSYTAPSPYATYPSHSAPYPLPTYPPANPSAYPPSYNTYPTPPAYPPQPYPPPPHSHAQYPPPPGPYPGKGVYPPPY